MKYFFCAETKGLYPGAVTGEAIGKPVVEITKKRYIELAGQQLEVDENGNPKLASTVYVPTETDLCQCIDTAADSARRAVAGDPLRAVEYDRARQAAEQFAAADYQGEVPGMVAAWAINGRTPQQATDDILREAAQYSEALVQLRTIRLKAKEQIRAAIAEGKITLAQEISLTTEELIKNVVAGLGNNAN